MSGSDARLAHAHGFLPPHPSPSAIAIMFHADIGKTLLYGIAIAIPVIVIAGPFFARTLKKIHAEPLKEFVNPKVLKNDEMPGMAVSVITATLPVILIILSTLLGLTSLKETTVGRIAGFIGSPSLALLISVLVAMYTLGLAREEDEEISK
jgi:Gnt-I system high-affinity gluconate transporter